MDASSAQDSTGKVVPLRREPQGVAAGSPRTRVQPPAHAWQLVAGEMQRSEQELKNLLGSRVDKVSEISRYLAASGGKRIRPLLTALGAHACGLGGDLSRLMCVGEMIHLASLLHDDVVDNAPTRRGKPAAHTVQGNALVILTGDFCLARAVLLAAEEGGHGCVTGLAEAVTAMSEGEVLQLERAGALDTPLETYRQIVQGKSAALISWCAAAGAHVLEDAELAERMEAFGCAVGEAFQITDDVLDYGGVLGTTGKQPGVDLLERKLTLPLLYAFEADPGLRPLLEAHPPTPDDLPELLERVRATGALERALETARERVAEGIAQLDILPDSPHKQALIDLANYLTERAA
ncbi:MAG: polyprenyl synthetase family protein [Myxococcota bacterium]|nr:polyprenyl synthetase family protein [Myxococcota bacterium]